MLKKIIAIILALLIIVTLLLPLVSILRNGRNESRQDAADMPVVHQVKTDEHLIRLNRL